MNRHEIINNSATLEEKATCNHMLMCYFKRLRKSSGAYLRVRKYACAYNSALQVKGFQRSNLIFGRKMQLTVCSKRACIVFV